MLATPFASKPNAIKATGPIAPTAIAITVIAFFTPSERLLNFSNIPPKNSTIGVIA